MLTGVRAVGGAFLQVYNHFLVSVLGNVATFIIALPVILVVGVFAAAAHSLGLIPIGLVLFVAIMPFPGAAGMHYVAYQLAERQIVFASDVLTGLRQYARRAALPWLLSCFVAIVILANIGFYGRLAGNHGGLSASAGLPLTVIWTCLLAAWITLHLYVYPLILRMEEVRLVGLYRNASIVAMRRPATSIFTCVVWVALLVLVSATGLSVVIGLALGAAMQQLLARALLRGMVTT